MTSSGSWIVTGVVRARNYEVFRERLKQAGMLDQAHDFVRASGALSAICYREDIEMALTEHPRVRAAAVVGFPNPRTGEEVHAFVESGGRPRDGSAALRKFCSARLSPLQIPQTFHFVASLPRNAMGKVRKFDLVKLLERSKA